MEHIQSKENSLIKEVRKLKEKKHRIQKKQFIIEGFRFVEEALQSEFLVEFLFVSEGQKHKWEELQMDKKVSKAVKAYWVSEAVLKSLSNTETPQGIVAVVQNKKLEIKNDIGCYVLVDQVQDPGNLGTIIRTAHAGGALAVILTKGTVDLYNEKTLRSTMGSIFKVPILEVDDFSFIMELKKQGYKLLVSALDGNKNFYEAELDGKIILSVGNEGVGISKEVKALADLAVKIPMLGDAESLNVAVAASIMIFETVRQRLEKNIKI